MVNIIHKLFIELKKTIIKALILKKIIIFAK